MTQKIYEQLGYGIVIPLKSNMWQVRANVMLIDKDSLTYHVTLEIGKENVPTWNVIDGDVFEMQTDNQKNINKDVVNFVFLQFKNGYFDSFMESYEEEVRAMAVGFERIESERLLGE